MPYNFLTRQVGPNAWGNTLSFAQLDGTLLYLSESVESLEATKVENSATGAFATNDALSTAIAGVVANSVTTSFALSAFTSSYALAVFTGSYATTASNSFRGSQTITGSLIASGSTHTLRGTVVVSGSETVTGDLTVGTNAQSTRTIAINRASGGGTQAILALQDAASTKYTVGIDTSNDFAIYDSTNASNVFAATSTLVSSNLAGGRTFRIASGGSNYIDISSSIAAYVPVSVAATTTVTGSLIASGSTHTITGATTATGTTTVIGATTVTGSFIASASAGHTLTGPTAIVGATTVTGATKVVGATTVTGSFIASASAGHTLTGPTAIVGATTVTGATNIVGATRVTGSLIASGSTHTITGDTTVTGTPTFNTPNSSPLVIIDASAASSGVEYRVNTTAYYQAFSNNDGTSFNIATANGSVTGLQFAPASYTLLNGLNNTYLAVGGNNKVNVTSTAISMSANLMVSASQVLTLQPHDPLPTTGVASGSFASSGSGANLKPYFWNGASWTALF